MNCNDELSRLSCNLLYGRFKPKRILGGERECGKEPNEHLGLLSSFNGKITNKSKKKTTKQIHTAIKSSGSLTITKERQQNQTLVEFSMVMPNVVR